MKYRESEEMYLETIYLLSKQKQNVHSIDVATELGFSRASVSRAVGLLQKAGYITVEKSGEILFTASGKKRADDIYERHETITAVLVKIGASDAVAEENACRFEHAITDELLTVMKEFIKR